MSNQANLLKFKDQLTKSIEAGVFMKVSLGNYQGNEPDLKRIYVRLVAIKRKAMLSFTYRFKTRDIVKNFPVPEGINKIADFISNDFRVATLLTAEREITLEQGRNQIISVRERAVDTPLEPTLSHDKEKKRIIQSAGKPYLQQLRISDAEGNVFKSAQDKYRQINQYIEILNTLIRELPVGSITKVVDMGAGKGYLTFALYDYLHHVLKIEASVVGVEYRADLVELCNDVAGKAGFNQLKFVQGTIEDYQVGTLDLLIALHACDTATDDAIYKGIAAGASLIVVAPCCHKQIRREMEKTKVKNEVSFVTKHGIFLERQAEMVTDGIRALILEYFGYKTKVIEFVSGVHTPKNILIIGTKGQISEKRQQEILDQLRGIKAFFGINHHHLQKLSKLSW